MTTVPAALPTQIAANRARFRSLHEQGCFIIPNPWDVGSAKWLGAKGFLALATTSAGLAWREGLCDQEVSCELMLSYIAQMVNAVPTMPINADFENGYGATDSELFTNVSRCVGTGIAGLSIEDATGIAAQPLVDFDVALHRFKVARQAVNASDPNVLLTARAEGLLYGDADGLVGVCKRLAAFADAGADVLYAPGVKTPQQIREVVAAAGGKPVNVVMFSDFGLALSELATLGVRRVSVGSALAKAAWTGFDRAVEDLLQGQFTALGHNLPSAILNNFFQSQRPAKG